MVLNRISQMINNINSGLQTFSFSVYPGETFQVIRPFLNCITIVFALKLRDLFSHLGDDLFTRYVIAKYFLFTLECLFSLSFLQHRELYSWAHSLIALTVSTWSNASENSSGWPPSRPRGLSGQCSLSGCCSFDFPLGLCLLAYD